MAQETIRVNCVESVYFSDSNRDGNEGKTAELKVKSISTDGRKTYYKNFSILSLI